MKSVRFLVGGKVQGVFFRASTRERAQALRQRGLDPAPVSPDEFRKFLLSEVVRWSKAVKQYNVKAVE